VDKRYFLTQLEKLISIRSVTSDVAECARITDHIAGIIPSAAKMERWDVSGVETLLAGNGDLLKPDIAIIVHADVVAADSELFRLRVKGDRLLGRGVSDMKFAIPIGIALLESVIRENLRVSVTLVFTTDEEQGGKNGVDHLVNHKHFHPATVIVPDWGDNFVFTDKSKGVATLLVESKGVTAHSSEIWKGKNANEAICRLAALLLEKYGPTNRRENWDTTMNIGVLSGGTVQNQVCADSYMKLDFRFPQTRTSEEIYTEVKKSVSGIDPDMQVSFLVSALPTNTDIRHPVVKSFLNSFKKVLGRQIVVAGGTGATDARHFAPLNIPLLVIKPDGGAVHSNDEWISLKGCLQYYEAINDFLVGYSGRYGRS